MASTRIVGTVRRLDRYDGRRKLLATIKRTGGGPAREKPYNRSCCTRAAYHSTDQTFHQATCPEIYPSLDLIGPFARL